MRKVTLITPKARVFSTSYLTELWSYRELLWAFVERDIKIRYHQTMIGGAWAIAQPLSTMVVFSFFFGKLADMPSDGVPYPVFSYAGLLLWTYFSNAVTKASTSLTGNSNLVSKVYFPRILTPIAATLTGFIDYGIALFILFGLMAYFSVAFSWSLIFLPFVLLLTWVLAAGIGFWLSAINTKYRDVGLILPFLIQLWLFITPVIYPTSVAGRFNFIVGLNPMTGVIEAHRAIFLHTGSYSLQLLLASLILSLIIFISGVLYFNKVEGYFADNI